jgi:hypothetical protein
MAKAAVDISVTGADKLAKIAAALKQAGHEDLRKELTAGLRRGTRPMPAVYKAGALGFLPFRGGLAEEVAAGMRFSIKVRTGGKSVGVRIVASLPGHDLRSMNRGRLRKPVFGNRRVWVNQQIRPEWWTDSGLVAIPAVRVELVRAIDAVGRKLESRIRRAA